MEPSDFDLLLDRYVEDKLSDAERLKFEAWMDVMKVHKDTNVELSKKDEQEIYKRIISKMTTPEDILKFTPQLIESTKKHHGVEFLPWMRIAAVILLLITASVVLYYYTATSPSLKEVIVDTDSQKVILNDGTLIWLGKGSVLKYTEVEGERVRNVSLMGAALFEVAKDTAHPFTIAAGDMKVTVLGTSFSIVTDTNSMDMKVLTGKVNISSTIDTKGIVVFANESLKYSPKGKIAIAPIQPTEIAAAIANTEYDMAFRNMPMRDVFSKIEKKFDVTLVVTNSKMIDCRITADFTDHSLADTMLLLSDILDLEYVVKNKIVTVTGLGCTN